MINRTSGAERGQPDAAGSDLAACWLDLAGPLAAIASAVKPSGRRLVARWAESHRRYHDLSHLTAALAAADLLAGHAEDPGAVRLAAWFHDAVYAGRPDDEERSAALAEAELGPAGLGVDPGLVAEVARLVRSTATHDPAPGDRNAEALSDADLAVLGSSAADYRRYAAAIREEYAHLPDEEFRTGRAAVLRTLLDRPWLFRTPLGRARWEDAARVNLSAELGALDGGR